MTTITTETLMDAPDGTASDRRVIGVGETITFRADRPVEWTSNMATDQLTGRQRVRAMSFNRAGIYKVDARVGSEMVPTEITVIEPSVRPRRQTTIRQFPESSDPSRQQVGVGMRLEFQLTPLNVCFAGLQFREQPGGADLIWGYFENFFAQHPDKSRHNADRNWRAVDTQNRLSVHDVAKFSMSPRHMIWPITRGGFRWKVNDEYRSGDTVRRFPRPMPQSFRIEPSGGQSNGSFTGSLSVNKGGITTRSTYRNNQLIRVT